MIFYTKKERRKLKQLHRDVESFKMEIDKIFSVAMSSATMGMESSKTQAVSTMTNTFIKKWTSFIDTTKKREVNGSKVVMKYRINQFCSRLLDYITGGVDFCNGNRDEIETIRDMSKELFEKTYSRFYLKKTTKDVTMDSVKMGMIVSFVEDDSHMIGEVVSIKKNFSEITVKSGLHLVNLSLNKCEVKTTSVRYRYNLGYFQI